MSAILKVIQRQKYDIHREKTLNNDPLSGHKIFKKNGLKSVKFFKIFLNFMKLKTFYVCIYVF